VKGSAKTIFDSNILGMSCARVCPVEVLCVGDCVYNHLGSPPIQIGKLQRYATDQAFERGWRFFEAGPTPARRSRCIGAGPASWPPRTSCAAGPRVTIYEKRDVVGGLNTTGVAPYKMKADRSRRRGRVGARHRRHRGPHGRLESASDVSAGSSSRSDDAIFLGFGPRPRHHCSACPGGALRASHGAVEFIERFKLGAVDLSGVRHAVVRRRRQHGDRRGPRAAGSRGAGRDDGLPRHRSGHERLRPRVEGREGGGRHRRSGSTQPVGYVGDGRQGHRREAASARRPRRSPSRAASTWSPADLVLVAIGQAKLGELVAGLDRRPLDGGRVVTTRRAHRPTQGVYAGGDCRQRRQGGRERGRRGRDAAASRSTPGSWEAN
jgi:dihydropyrimidine dehydrogenase (NAD+) subunit PreT